MARSVQQEVMIRLANEICHQSNILLKEANERPGDETLMTLLCRLIENSLRMQYLQFDLEATRREKGALLRLLQSRGTDKK
jgi:hypothetical protein